MQEMIQFALELKFGLSSRHLAKKIKNIDDYEKLKEIKIAIKSCDSLKEFTESVNI